MEQKLLEQRRIADANQRTEELQHAEQLQQKMSKAARHATFRQAPPLARVGLPRVGTGLPGSTASHRSHGRGLIHTMSIRQPTSARLPGATTSLNVNAVQRVRSFTMVEGKEPAQSTLLGLSAPELKQLTVHMNQIETLAQQLIRDADAAAAAQAQEAVVEPAGNMTERSLVSARSTVSMPRVASMRRRGSNAQDSQYTLTPRGVSLEATQPPAAENRYPPQPEDGYLQAYVPDNAIESLRYSFAREVVSWLGMAKAGNKSGSGVDLLIASSFPLAVPEGRSYRGIMFYDKAVDRMYVRRSALQDPGELMVALAYVLASLRVRGDRIDDCLDSEVLAQRDTNLVTCGKQCFTRIFRSYLDSSASEEGKAGVELDQLLGSLNIDDSNARVAAAVSAGGSGQGVQKGSSRGTLTSPTRSPSASPASGDGSGKGLRRIMTSAGGGLKAWMKRTQSRISMQTSEKPTGASPTKQGGAAAQLLGPGAALDAARVGSEEYFNVGAIQRRLKRYQQFLHTSS